MPCLLPETDWIINSGGSSHITGTRDFFIRFSQLSDINSVSIADGQSCLIAGEGAVHAFSQITIEKVLLVHDFPDNLLSISAITK